VKSSLLRCVILIRTLRCLAPASVYTRWVELSELSDDLSMDGATGP